MNRVGRPAMARGVLAFAPKLVLPLALLLALLQASGCSAPEREQAASASSYDTLLQLFEEFRLFAAPAVIDGVPDYSAAAMQAQHARVAEFERRLRAIDDRDWPIEQRVDWTLVLAEIRGLDFHHRVLAPWRRDPAFYSTVYLGFGPRLHGTMSLPELPLDSAAALAGLEEQLRAIPVILAQARANLVELKGDLAMLAISRKRVERNMFERFATALDESHAELAPHARAARDAIDEFIGWLEEAGPQAPRHAGIGVEQYDWFARHVLLYPYSWEEMLVIGEREYERAMAFFALEEHRNRDVPLVAPADTLEEFERRRAAADADLLAFLAEERVLTVPDYVVPTPGQGPYILPWDRDPTARGPFEAPIERHFFRQTEDREPLPLRAHNTPGHLMDSAMQARDERPIRGAGLLFFIQANRAEGWAYYLEGMIQQLGLLHDRPGAREVNAVLQAKRAARIRPELMMHSGEWTFEQALESLTTRTPRWMAPDDPIAIYDLELYLRQPGLGVNYPIGRIQIEQLLAEVARERGDAFDLQAFHDEFVAAGMIPISLIRWQMTGRDDQVAPMRAEE
jgi:uncharacterized protein (DUF885 family)